MLPKPPRIMRMLSTALDAARREPVARARLRLAMQCLSGAAEAKPSIAATDEWRLAQAGIAKLLGQKAELQGSR